MDKIPQLAQGYLSVLELKSKIYRDLKDEEMASKYNLWYHIFFILKFDLWQKSFIFTIRLSRVEMKKTVILLMAILLFVIQGNGSAEEKASEMAPSEFLLQRNRQLVFYSAFSHNDYWRSKPLSDALAYRFNCVEADVWLVNGQLYVAHDESEIDQTCTFEEMYLKPLVERVRKIGKVYAGSEMPFFLMVDCKSNGEEIYPVLKSMIEPYKNLFCSVENGIYKESTILLFLSGDRPLQTLPLESCRYMFLDGRLNDLGKDVSEGLMPVVSDNYKNYFSWDGEGDMPEQELRKMRDMVNQVHEEGKLIRWWGTPESKTFMQFLIDEDVDLIGTDNLKLLYDVLQEYYK